MLLLYYDTVHGRNENVYTTPKLNSAPVSLTSNMASSHAVRVVATFVIAPSDLQTESTSSVVTD